MNKELKTILKNVCGNVLGIGLSSELSDVISANDKIIECNLLETASKSNEKGRGKSKTVKIKKIRKQFKKKRVDYIVCNYETIKKYMNSFVKNSIYINKNKLIFFGDVDIELVKKRYKRYDCKITEKKFNDKIIIEIDNSNAKNKFFKDFIFQIIDFTTEAISVIGDILMN